MLVLLAACGSTAEPAPLPPGNARNALPEALGGEQAAPASQSALRATAGGFALTVLPESFLIPAATAEFTIDTQSQAPTVTDSSASGNQAPAGETDPAFTGATDAGVVVTIAARKAVDLRALYCDLRYDPEHYTPVSVEHLAWPCNHGCNEVQERAVPGAMAITAGSAAEPAAGGAGSDERLSDVNAGMLTLEVLSDRGMVHLGQVLAHWDRRVGLTGDAELARVLFAARPFAQVRSTSTALNWDSIAPYTTLNVTGKTIRWLYYYPGDYDQNGLVTAADLTPLGRYLDSGEAEAPPYIQELLDGNHDNHLTIHDITAIGQRFGEGIDEWHLFASTAPKLQYPASNDAESSLMPAAVFQFSAAAQGDAGQEQVYFEVALPMTMNGLHFWVRPSFKGVEGSSGAPLEFESHLGDSFPVVVHDRTSYRGGSAECLKQVYRDADYVYVALFADRAERLHVFSVEVPYDLDLFRYLQASWEHFPESIHSHASYMGQYPVVCGAWTAAPGTDQGFSGHIRLFELAFREKQRDDSEISIDRRAPGTDSNISLRLKDAGLRYDGAKHELSWMHNQLADYDQNGVVNSEDLLMVGYHFNSPATDHGSIGYFVDGNYSDEVGITDVNPVVLDPASAVDGYNVYATANPAKWPDYPQTVYVEELHRTFVVNVPDFPYLQPIAHVDLDEAAGDWLTERLRFKVVLASLQIGKAVWVVPTWKGAIGGIGPGAYLEIPDE